MNPGLRRRFQWYVEIPPCDGKALHAILVKMLQEQNMTLEDGTISPEWFTGKMGYFPNYGGSIENFVSKIRLAHSRRVFGGHKIKRGLINKVDLDYAYNLYTTYESSHKKDDRPPDHMYT